MYVSGKQKLVSVSKRSLIQRIRYVYGRLQKQKGNDEVMSWKVVISGHSSLILMAKGKQKSRHSKVVRNWEVKGGVTERCCFNLRAPSKAVL